MNNYRLEMVKRHEAHTGNEIDCLHVIIDSNSNKEIADTYIPLDDILTAMKQPKSTTITGLMLRAHGNDAVVELEIDGKWHEIVRCDMRGSFSHIVEPLGIERAIETGKPCSS